MLLCVCTVIFFIYFLNYAGDGEPSTQSRDKMNTGCKCWQKSKKSGFFFGEARKHRAKHEWICRGACYYLSFLLTASGRYVLPGKWWGSSLGAPPVPAFTTLLDSIHRLSVALGKIGVMGQVELHFSPSSCKNIISKTVREKSGSRTCLRFLLLPRNFNRTLRKAFKILSSVQLKVLSIGNGEVSVTIAELVTSVWLKEGDTAACHTARVEGLRWAGASQGQVALGGRWPSQSCRTPSWGEADSAGWGLSPGSR